MAKSSSLTEANKFPRRIKVTDLRVGDAFRRDVYSWTVAILLEPVGFDHEYQAPVTRYVLHGKRCGLIWANTGHYESVWLLARMEDVQSHPENDRIEGC